MRNKKKHNHDTIDLNVNASFLAKAFTRPDFLDVLNEAACKTYEDFDEAGFHAYVSLDGKVSVSDVHVGTNESMFRLGRDSDDIDLESDIMLLFMHFHPEKTGPAVPSYGDLSLVTAVRKCAILTDDSNYIAEYRPLYAVGKARANHDIELLVFQEQRLLSSKDVRHADNAIIRYLESNGVSPIEDSIVHSDIHTSQISKILSDSGYNSAVLRYNEPIWRGSYARRIIEKHRDNFEKKLSSFAQTIRIKECNQDELDKFFLEEGL